MHNDSIEGSVSWHTDSFVRAVNDDLSKLMKQAYEEDRNQLHNSAIKNYQTMMELIKELIERAEIMQKRSDN